MTQAVECAACSVVRSLSPGGVCGACYQHRREADAATIRRYERLLNAEPSDSVSTDLATGARKVWTHGPPTPVRVVRVENENNVIVENDQGEQFNAHPVELQEPSETGSTESNG